MNKDKFKASKTEHIFSRIHYWIIIYQNEEKLKLVFILTESKKHTEHIMFSKTHDIPIYR